MDRTIDLILIFLAIAILVHRHFKWGKFLRQNLALIIFVSFALVSILWSDFAFIALKRWFRDLGNYLVILIPLSDPSPVEAVGTLLRRLFYILISLSILLVRYFLEIGRGYDVRGNPMFVGPTTGKNLLGVLGMLSALFFLWDTLVRWPERKIKRNKRTILINFAFLVMSVYVVKIANSATSRVCLALGCMVILAAQSKFSRRRPVFIKVLIPTVFFLYVILAYGFGLNGSMAAAIGKDPSLTDRTLIWAYLLKVHINPIVGTGYESFWMGSRLLDFWQNSGQGAINEAHNGFLEMYLNLGYVGVLLIIGFVFACYRNVCTRLKPYSAFASLTLAVWIVFLFYCATEAGFRSGLIWSMFLMGGVMVKGHKKDDLSTLDVARTGTSEKTEGIALLSSYSS